MSKLKLFIGKFNGVIFLSVFVVFFLSLMLSFFLYDKIKEDIYKSKETSVESSGKILTRYIVDTYDLYYNSGTLKFQEIMNNVNHVNRDISSFQILTVDKDIVFDSRIDFDTSQDLGKSDLEYDVLHSNDIYVKKNGEEIDYFVVPNIDDWGNHKYSVKYLVNYSNEDSKLYNFKFTLAVLIIGINCITILVLFIFSSNEKYQLAKERAKDLDSINHIKDEFMVLVSHNLRTPLSVIKGYMSFIADPRSSKEEIKEDIADMEEGVNKLSSLVEDIVFATSILSGEEKFVSEKVDLEKIIGEVMLKYDDQIKNKGLEFNYNVVGEKTFTGDKKALGKVFENLIDNAVKFNMENGNIDVRVENEAELKIIVSDTGAGIESDKLDSIIGFFHRGSDILNYNFGGEGMGLYLTNLIIKHYNGQIYVTSEKDKGSTFEVILKKENK